MLQQTRRTFTNPSHEAEASCLTPDGRILVLMAHGSMAFFELESDDEGDDDDDENGVYPSTCSVDRILTPIGDAHLEGVPWIHGTIVDACMLADFRVFVLTNVDGEEGTHTSSKLMCFGEGVTFSPVCLENAYDKLCVTKTTVFVIARDLDCGPKAVGFCIDTGRQTIVIKAQVVSPSSMLSWTDGRLVISDAATNDFVVFESDGTFVSKHHVPVRIDDMCLSKEGTLLVADYEARAVVECSFEGVLNCCKVITGMGLAMEEGFRLYATQDAVVVVDRLGRDVVVIG